MEKRAAELEAEVERWLSAAEAADAEEDRAFGRDKSGDELPKGVADEKKRVEKIRAAKAELEAEAKEAAAAKAKAQAEERRTEAEGRKKPGRPDRPGPIRRGQTGSQSADELHRSRKPHHEDGAKGQLHPGLQCAGGGRRDGAGDRRPRPRREAERSTSIGADGRRHRSQSAEPRNCRRTRAIAPTPTLQRWRNARSTPISRRGDLAIRCAGDHRGSYRVVPFPEHGGEDPRRFLPAPLAGQRPQATTGATFATGMRPITVGTLPVSRPVNPGGPGEQAWRWPTASAGTRGSRYC